MMFRSAVIAGCAIGAFIGLAQSVGTIGTFYNEPLKPIPPSIQRMLPTMPDPPPTWTTDDMPSMPINTPQPEYKINTEQSDWCIKNPGIVNCGMFAT